MPDRAQDLKVIVGLGNPGHTFTKTRHNVGFRVIDRLSVLWKVRVAERLVSPQDGRPAGVYGDAEYRGQRVRLLMPLTMMNESGEAVRGLDVPPGRLLIVCDDVHLPLGRLRLRASGGAGGHHGLASCLDALSTEEIPRLRVGIGVLPLPADLEEFVLGPFTADEAPMAAKGIEQAAEACEAWVGHGIEVVMNRFNAVTEG